MKYFTGYENLPFCKTELPEGNIHLQVKKEETEYKIWAIGTLLVEGKEYSFHGEFTTRVYSLFIYPTSSTDLVLTIFPMGCAARDWELMRVQTIIIDAITEWATTNNDIIVITPPYKE